nr:HTH domain-containing protein [Granulosicoccus sp.]
MKKPVSVESELRPDTAGLLADVAELYYKDGLTQHDIAQRIGVSRPTVVNYIKQAREQGIVDIQIRGSAYKGSNLSRQLCEKYGLVDVYIARTAAEKDQAVAQIKLARLGAMALSDLLREHDVLGVSWGRTIQLAATEFPRRPIKHLTVSQLVGSVPTDALFATEESTIRIAKRTGAKCNTLPVPAILSTVQLAEQLRAEPIVQKHLSQFTKLTKVIFSVGDLSDESMVYDIGMHTKAEWETYKSQGAKGVLVGRLVDDRGDVLDSDFNQRIL